MNKEKEHNCIGKDELLVQTKSNIAKYGLQVITVSGSDYFPSFSYSIGLFEIYKQPEIICFGLPNKLGHEIINDLAELMKKGETVKTYTNYDNIFKNSRAEFLQVDSRNIGDYFGVALNYYDGIKFPAIQVVWTDRNNKFPWEDNFEEKFLYYQPLLDRNAEFKFREVKNLGVFTTRQWLELDEPILEVYHDNDGDWQFLTAEPIIEKDAKLVALEELVKKDSTLNEVFDLDYGEKAKRKDVGEKWTRTKIE